MDGEHSLNRTNGSDLALTGNKDVVSVLIEAADSLVDRFDPKVGCIRSWDKMVKIGKPDIYRLDNTHEHYLVIVDNLVRPNRIDG